MPVRLPPAEVPAWVAGRLRGRPGTRWIGVDGFGAAGKSTLAAAIAAELPGAVLVSVDDFARHGLRGWHIALFTEQVLDPLRAGAPGRYRRWDLRSDTGLGWAEVPAGVPVVLEGVSCTDVRAPVPWDVRLWVEVPEAERRRRIADRDGPDLLPVWEQDWWPSEQAWAAEQTPWARADAIVLGNQPALSRGVEPGPR